jgi:hypothetical protein
MAEEKETEKKEMGPEQLEELFKGFVSLVAGIAMQQLGKVINPVTGKVERNLDIAKAWIETLRMIKLKTRGNLSDSESRFLESTIAGLQMNYVDEVKKGPEKPEKEEETPAAVKNEKKAEEREEEKKEEEKEEKEKEKTEKKKK